MIAIISPAKTMRSIAPEGLQATEPIFMAQAKEIMETLVTLNPWEIQTKMKVNERLGESAFEDLQHWNDKDQIDYPALTSYDGLVFQHIQGITLSKDQWDFAQDHVRILSGLYGMLRPLDGIRPYRLEMGSSIKIEGQSLYAFWSQQIAEEVLRNDEPILNLASKEYSRCVKKYLRPDDLWIDVEFLTMRKGKLRTIVAWAKMARGEMIRYILDHKINDPEKITAFSYEGYTFEPSLSSKTKFVFVQQ